MDLLALPKVYVTQRILKEGMDLLNGHVDYKMWRGEGAPDRATLLREVQDVEGLLSMPANAIDDELFSHAPKLKVVSQHAVGFDNIDIEAAKRHGIMICNTPDVLTDATADLAFTLLLAAARRLVECSEYLRRGQWTTWYPDMWLGMDTAGKKLGIVGFGQIGQAVARRAKGFGMSICYYNPSAKPAAEKELGAQRVSLDELLQTSDYVTLHCPLKDETRSLIGERELRMMKPTAILVNTSRGLVVDQKALCKALSEKWIWAAGLDVFAKEPVPLDEPLLTLPNVTVMPHMGSATYDSRGGMSRLAAQNLIDALEGRQPLYVVNP
ncbi:MAG: D-glycerate dehydrogenase [Aminobacterium colombiense]|nr:D-glycerate dehydrogenase [Aminobacterium colombiense]